PGASYDYTSAPDAMIERAHRIADVCERYGVDLPSAALAYPLRRPEVVSVVVGVRSRAQAESTLQRYLATAPEEMWRELFAARLVAA
ncbi:aldo/keto reductase, partial [Staphylococcus aureus]